MIKKKSEYCGFIKYCYARYRCWGRWGFRKIDLPKYLQKIYCCGKKPTIIDYGDIN